MIKKTTKLQKLTDKPRLA